MKAEKQIIIDTLLEKVNASPFLLVADYTGMTVDQFGELRKRLRENGAECRVVKNTYVKKAIQEANLPDIHAELVGQTALVTGEADICATAKSIQTFADEFDKPKVKVGVLDNKLIDEAQFKALASLPTREVLLGQLLGVLQAPASQLARLLNEPGSALARVLNAKAAAGN